MGTAAQAVVEKFLEIFHSDASPDRERLGDYMAADAVYWALVPSAPPLHGLDAICAGLQKQFGTYRDCRCEMHAIGTGEGVVFTERTDHVTLNHDDRKVSARISAIFEVNADNKITAWREYWDSEDVLKQMGVDRAALAAAIN